MNSTTRAKRKSHITLEATTRRQDSEGKTVVGGHQKHEQGNRNIKQEDHEAPEPKNQEAVPAGMRASGAQKGHAPSIPRAKARNQNTCQTRASGTTAYQEETDVPENDVELQVILLDLRAAHLHWEAGRSSSHATPKQELKHRASLYYG